MVESILAYLRIVVLTTLIQLCIFFFLGLILVFVMHFESKFIERRALSVISKAWYLASFGWLGTIVHELGHAIFCLIFHHKITKMRLFDPDPHTGTLGYVEHSYNTNSIYQLAGNFFIGIGPILLGMAIIYLLFYLLLGINPFKLAGSLNMTSFNFDSLNSLRLLFLNLWNSSTGMLGEVFSMHNIFTWQLWAFIYLVFAIGSSITLSPADIKSTFKGAGIISALLFILNTATVWAGDFSSKIVMETGVYFSVFYITILLILLLNIIIAALVILPLSVLRTIHAKSKL